MNDFHLHEKEKKVVEGGEEKGKEAEKEKGEEKGDENLEGLKTAWDIEGTKLARFVIVGGVVVVGGGGGNGSGGISCVLVVLVCYSLSFFYQSPFLFLFFPSLTTYFF